MTNYWKLHMVYGNDRTYDEINAHKGYISIYWDTGDLFELVNLEQNKFEEKLDEILREMHPDYSNNQIGAERGSIQRFVYDMEIGDVIISPGYDETCYLGFVKSNYLFSNGLHYRKVEWKPISRKDISDDLDSAIGRPPTITSLNPYRV